MPQRTGPIKPIKSSSAVLVVGDWFVDEYWVVGDHRSEASSRTGLRHTRALASPSGSIRSLCGAGQVATILSSQHPVIGIGHWWAPDTDILQEMLNPFSNIGKTPHRLSHGAVPRYPQSPRENLSLLFPLCEKPDAEISTTTIVRVYKQAGKEIQHLERYDWEITPAPALAKAILDSLTNRLDELFRTLRSRSVKIQSVVVKDHGRGVVTSQLVRELTNRVPGATWFVSTKDWGAFDRGNWVDSLPRDDVRLIFLPDKAAEMAVQEEAFHGNNWITFSGWASQEAIVRLDAIADRFPRSSIVVFPEGLSVLAREANRSVTKRAK